MLRIGLFQGKFAFTLQNLLNGCFYYYYFTPNFLNWYFFELLFLVGDRKIIKIYQWKLKSGDWLWVLETAFWKLCFYGKLFSIRQNLKLPQFYRVSLDDLRALLMNTFKKLPLINSEINLRPPQHLKWSWLMQ